MARPLVWISPIGAMDELASRAKAKTYVFRVFQRKCSNVLQENVFPYERGCHEGGFRSFYCSQVTGIVL